jgi:hypothetical protein
MLGRRRTRNGIIKRPAIAAHAAAICVALVVAAIAARMAGAQGIPSAAKTTNAAQTAPPAAPANSKSGSMLASKPALSLGATSQASAQRSRAANVKVHRFWDKENDWLFAGIGITRALDFASTANFRARGRQEILLTNSVVDNKPLFAAIEIAATGASIGVSYIFHRTGHHRLERWVSFVHIGVTGFGVVRNYSLESAHSPRSRRPALFDSASRGSHNPK